MNGSEKRLLRRAFPPCADEIGRVYEENGERYSEGCAIENTFKLNAKDFSVTEIVSESIFPTGAREDAGILTVAYDRDVPEEAQSLFDRAKPTADIRTLTVVLDPNTEKEKVLSKTVRKGDLFGIVIPDGYEMFSDEECTVPYVSDGNADSHVLIYSKKP